MSDFEWEWKHMWGRTPQPREHDHEIIIAATLYEGSHKLRRRPVANLTLRFDDMAYLWKWVVTMRGKQIRLDTTDINEAKAAALAIWRTE